MLKHDYTDALICVDKVTKKVTLLDAIVKDLNFLDDDEYKTYKKKLKEKFNNVNQNCIWLRYSKAKELNYV